MNDGASHGDIFASRQFKAVAVNLFAVLILSLFYAIAFILQTFSHSVCLVILETVV